MTKQYRLPDGDGCRTATLGERYVCLPTATPKKKNFYLSPANTAKSMITNRFQLNKYRGQA